MSDTWVYGYGSLVWRPAFAWAERRIGFVRGQARRFWQGSTDHRGVPGAPGRVVTLVPEAEAVTWGVAYRLPEAEQEAILAGLDHREQGGYARLDLRVHTVEGDVLEPVLAWVALPGNRNWLGPASAGEIAATVRVSVGPSGANLEYVQRLWAWHREHGLPDPHLQAIVDALS